MATIIGNKSANTLNGSSSSDTIDGGGGNDILRGYGGADTLIGGSGNDTFVFESTAQANGIDILKDYHYSATKGAEQDILDLSLLFGSLSSKAKINNYAELRVVDGKIALFVDKDGTGSKTGWEQIAIFDNFIGGELVRIKAGSSFFTLPPAPVLSTAPTISSVVLEATGAVNSTLNVGDVVSVTVTFNENVTVSGTPLIILNIGGTDVPALYASGSGTAELVFQYTISAGDTDANGISIPANSINLNGGTIQNGSNEDALLDFSALTDNSAYKVDTAAPTITTAVLTDDELIYSVLNTGDKVIITLTFSENVTVTGTPRIALTVGSSTVYADYVSGSTTTALVFEYIIASGNSDADGISVGALDLNGGSIVDAAGNASVNTFTAPTGNPNVDTTAPTGIILSFTERTTVGSEGVNVTMSADEAITATAVVDATGTAPNFYFTTGSYTNVKGTAVDLAGNSGESATYKLEVGTTGNDPIDLSATSVASYIFGLAGNDTIIGSTAADIMTGGSGNDKFKYTNVAQSSTSSRDLITDFVSGQDKIDVTSLISAANYTALKTGGGSAGNEELVVTDAGNGTGSAALGSLGANQFRFVTNYDSGTNETILQFIYDTNAASGGSNTADSAIVYIRLTGQIDLTANDFDFGVS